MLEFFKNNIFEIITAFVAIYGAFLSTLNYLNARDKLIVKIHYNFLIRGLLGNKKEDKYLLVTITNISKEINTIQSIGFLGKDKKKIIYLNMVSGILKTKLFIFPKKIESSQRLELQFSKRKLKELCERNSFSPSYISVVDTAGKIYNTKFNISRI